MDDIVVLFQLKNRPKVESLVNKLKAAYKMKDLSTLKWFLGIQIIRYRPTKTWLLQDSYMEKLAHDFLKGRNITYKNYPILEQPLDKYTGIATAHEIY